uniref:Uncharacterized protein n=1 Tax=Brassica oleracea TaxID=3712 RepID=A0A3P6ANC6_BRAOL|nr:unnamed protein product [Brassica oleracea]
MQVNNKGSMFHNECSHFLLFFTCCTVTMPRRASSVHSAKTHLKPFSSTVFMWTSASRSLSV